MLKQKKWTLILSSLLILLPTLVGLLLWNQLPERMVTHWGLDGQPDGWSSRTFVVFGMPLLLLALHWLCVFITTRDSKNKEQNGKVFSLVLWTTPAVSLFAAGLSYAPAFGVDVPVAGLTYLLLGTVFLLVGNYLPKCRQNRTIGIKVKWTLENEENWNATHRMAGKLWAAGGVLLLLGVFLPEGLAFLLMFPLILVLAFAPMFYSWNYAKQQHKNERDML